MEIVVIEVHAPTVCWAVQVDGQVRGIYTNPAVAHKVAAALAQAAR